MNSWSVGRIHGVKSSLNSACLYVSVQNLWRSRVVKARETVVLFGD